MNLYKAPIFDNFEDPKMLHPEWTGYDPLKPIQANSVTGSQPPVNPWGPELNKPYVAPEPVAPPVTAPTAKPLPPIDPNSYLGGLIANSTPKPKYNQKSEDQLLNMAKAQKIGEFLGLLGDVYGTAKGAPVQRRESTSAAPYMQSILARQDKYQDQLADFDKQEYLRKLQIGQAFDTKKSKDEADQWREKNFNADQEYKGWLKENQIADNKLNREKWDKQVSLQEYANKTDRIRANKTGSETDKSDKLIKVETSKQVHELTPEKYNRIKREVLTNIDKYKDKYKNWFVEKPEMVYDEKKGEDVPTGKVTIELRPQIKEDELVGAYLEEQDNPTPNPKPGTPEYFDQYRNEGQKSTDPIIQPGTKQKPVSEFSDEQEKQLSILQKNNPQLTRQQIIDLISK